MTDKNLIGSGPNQVPLNNMLGDMAFQNTDEVHAKKFMENGYPVVSGADVGTNPDQIPTNAFLGPMAYAPSSQLTNPYCDETLSINRQGLATLTAGQHYPGFWRVQPSFNHALNTTYTYELDFSLVYGHCEVMFSSYNGAGSGGCMLKFIVGSHSGNNTTTQLIEVGRTNYGNTTIGAPYKTGGQVRFGVTIANSGNAGTATVSLFGMTDGSYFPYVTQL
jgi:hypothetical protein